MRHTVEIQRAKCTEDEKQTGDELPMLGPPASLEKLMGTSHWIWIVPTDGFLITLGLPIRNRKPQFG